MTEKPVQYTPAELLKAKKHPDIVEVPDRVVLAIDGAGGPEEPGFAASIGALYGISYGLRFARKAAGRPVFKVGVLEGEWRAEGADLSVHEIPARETWRWRLQMALPPDVTSDELAAMVEAATTKKGGKLHGSEEARRLALAHPESGGYARILHVGPYATEPESFARIDDFLADQGRSREPWHVEVYLSDPGRTAPEKLKTALLTKLVGPGEER
jgi:hypothetical protein